MIVPITMPIVQQFGQTWVWHNGLYAPAWYVDEQKALCEPSPLLDFYNGQASHIKAEITYYDHELSNEVLGPVIEPLEPSPSEMSCEKTCKLAEASLFGAAVSKWAPASKWKTRAIHGVKPAEAFRMMVEDEGDVIDIGPAWSTFTMAVRNDS